MQASIIICTRNHAPSLEKTLRAIGQVCVPEGWHPELILVDNASTDHTAEVVHNAQMDGFMVRYLYEAKGGQSNALNTALAAARGEVLLFTDDDVVPAKNWLERMVTPLLQRECEAVVGHIELAKHLWRPWMTPEHNPMLAGAGTARDATTVLIGANMGFHRCVLKQVPAFDSELGPGALGFIGDTLFSWQLREAGFRLKQVPESSVVHHPNASRLLRSQWLAGARKLGGSIAYIHHHWLHRELPRPHFRFYYVGFKLLLRRLIQPPPPLDEEGCPPWEISYVCEMEASRRYLLERSRPRNYSKQGLMKKV